MNQEAFGERSALINAKAKATLVDLRAEAERHPVLMWFGGRNIILKSANMVREVRRDAITRLKRGI